MDRHAFRPRRSLWVLGLAAVALLLLAAAATSPARAAAEAPTFAGTAACASCHAGEAAAWRGSHHDLAMQEASGPAVLGDFGDARFSHGGVQSRFFRRAGKPFVTTDGPDGRLADFEIRYTFGVDPLQQYLIGFPDGRLQALGIAWDSRPADEGGQRWFHLYPDRPPKPGEPLHWTGIDQTWNFMCSECHSTGLRKNYDAATDTYATTWAEIDVGCESCHGPGSAHVARAKARSAGEPAAGDGLVVRFDERRDVHWSLDPATGSARRSRPPATSVATEVETCGVCHARASKIAEPWRPGAPLLQTHLPSLLRPGLFEADGKMLDEVFNWAPFRQSRMFQAGVTCSDCHDPHSLKLVAEGNAVCSQCHDPARFDVATHHHHAPGSAAGRCTACHMPSRLYMVVDRRHDHGFRIPRPDESVRFGTSNACTDCHGGESAAWAAAAVGRWYGPQRRGFQTWTATFAAARAGAVEAAPSLSTLAGDADAPAIVRATAFDHLSAHPSALALAAARTGLADADPLVRLGALRILQSLPPQDRWPLARDALRDPVRGNRIEAAALLASVPESRLSPAERADLGRAIDDFVATQRLNADRPESRVNLATLWAERGRAADAEAEFRAALAHDPRFVPAVVGLAQLQAGRGDVAGGERVLRDGLGRLPENADLHLALGLNLVRQRRLDEALRSIGRAAELQPGNARYAYVYAVGLNSAGRRDEALRLLEANQARHPADRDTLVALATINRDAGRPAAAIAWAERLVALDPTARPFLDQLRATPPR